MRLVARDAAVGANGCVLVNERAAFIAVAFVTTRFIGSRDGAHCAGDVSAVRVVAIHARHGAFREPVLIRPVERGPLRNMAGCALMVDIVRLARDYFLRGLVHRVTAYTSHLILGVGALNPARMSRLI